VFCDRHQAIVGRPFASFNKNRIFLFFYVRVRTVLS
jgi:hypothetical protein